MDQNMIKEAAKVWDQLTKQGKIQWHKSKQLSTVTITFTAGDYDLISAALRELEEEKEE